MFKFACYCVLSAVTAPRDVACGGGRALPGIKKLHPTTVPQTSILKTSTSALILPWAFASPTGAPRRKKRGFAPDADLYCVGCVCVFFCFFFLRGRADRRDPGGSAFPERRGRARARTHTGRHTQAHTHTHTSKQEHTHTTSP